MAALLATNPWLGIEETNWDHIYLLALSFGILIIVLLVFRGIGILREKASQKKNAWDTFYQLSKARGLNKAQAEILATIAKKSRISSPARLLGSIQLFDKSLEKASHQIELDERQDILLEKMRKKLATAKEIWSESDGDRRQLARVRCSWNIRASLVRQSELDKEVLRLGAEGEENLSLTVQTLGQKEGVEKYPAQISNISAGGVAMLTSSSFTGSTGDVLIISAESERIPFTIDGVCAQLRTIEEDEKRGLYIVHTSFLPIESDLRRDIIHYVYEKVEKKKKRKKTKIAPAAPSTGENSPS